MTSDLEIERYRRNIDAAFRAGAYAFLKKGGTDPAIVEAADAYADTHVRLLRPVAPAGETVPVLYGDGVHDDTAAILAASQGRPFRRAYISAADRAAAITSGGAPAGDFLAKSAKNAPAGDREAVGDRVRALEAALSVSAVRFSQLAVELDRRGADAVGVLATVYQQQICDVLGENEPAHPAEERAVASAERDLLDRIKLYMECEGNPDGVLIRMGIAAVAWYKAKAALSRARTGSEG